MIGHLRGTLLEKAPSRLIVDVGGVGYDVQVPLSTFYVVGDPGVTVSLRIHTHVREDVIALYGFATALEHDVFERLIGISGIGPKLALAVLSGIEPADLIAAVRQQDVARLTAIPGIGKKTAERISLELKDRLPTALTPAGQPVPAAAPEDQLKTDLISALLNLGYQRPAAERAIEKVTAGGAPAGFEQALKDVLRLLMRGRT
jgi:Holliday junction DNA helicase RuvA